MILAAGEALMDLVPQGAAYLPRPGGAPLNVAVTLARLGVQAGFLGGLARDAFGRRIQQHLEASGVRLDYAVEVDRPTPLALVTLEAGEPQYAFYLEGTAFMLERLPGLGPEVRAVCLGGLATACAPVDALFAGLLEAGRFVALDPNVRPAAIRDPGRYRERFAAWVPRVDLLKVSAADLAWLFPDTPPQAAARRLQEAGARVVVLTLGARGAVAFLPEGTVRVAAPRVRVVDTVGAGDAFLGGLLAFWDRAGLLDRPFAPGLEATREALAFAARVAALTCTCPGADPPRAADVEEPSP